MDPKGIEDSKMSAGDISSYDHLDDRKRIRTIFEQDTTFYKEDDPVVVPSPADRTSSPNPKVDVQDVNSDIYKQPSQDQRKRIKKGKSGRNSYMSTSRLKVSNLDIGGQYRSIIKD